MYKVERDQKSEALEPWLAHTAVAAKSLSCFL